jgi:hypothetical protein
MTQKELLEDIRRKLESIETILKRIKSSGTIENGRIGRS